MRSTIASIAQFLFLFCTGFVAVWNGIDPIGYNVGLLIGIVSVLLYFIIKGKG